MNGILDMLIKYTCHLIMYRISGPIYYPSVTVETKNKTKKLEMNKTEKNRTEEYIRILSMKLPTSIRIIHP